MKELTETLTLYMTTDEATQLHILAEELGVSENDTLRFILRFTKVRDIRPRMSDRN